MPKVSAYCENGNVDGKVTGYMIFCPACNCGHLFNTVPGNNSAGKPKPVWTFNGSFERPTFRASMLVKSVSLPKCDPNTGDFARGIDGKYLLDDSGRILGTKDTICHSHVTDGMIQFLSDSTHSLAGKTVDLPDMDNLGGNSGRTV